MRTVVFVGGTAFSGSTLLGMSLANDPTGFAVGEPHNHLQPTRPHHPNLVCACGDKHCAVWQEVRKNGPDKLYETIFDLFPEVEFIVDSSKDPFWIRSQGRRLEQVGIRTKNLLIWKTPLELAYSFKKRGKPEAWERAWVGYHRLYTSVVEDWKAIRYREYVEDPTVLETTCRYLQVPYTVDKARFWEKAHHVIGGNHSAKIHLYAEGTPRYESSVAKHGSIGEERIRETHRQVYYQSVNDPELHNHVEERIRESALIGKIVGLLDARDISRDTPAERVPSGIRLSGPAVRARELRRALVLGIGSYRYGRSYPD